MATCKICKRSGLFFSVNKYKLCTTCSSGMMIEVTSNFRVIQESQKLAETGKSLDVRVSRCDLVVEYCQHLLKYEKLGIPVTNPLPSVIMKTYSEKRIKIVKDGLIEETKTALDKAKLATTTNSKVSALSKAVFKIADYKKQYPHDKDLQMMDDGLRKAIQEIQLKKFLDDAKKAELKKNSKKALDNYYEALYFLQHDDIDDALQDEVINFIKSKIDEHS